MKFDAVRKMKLVQRGKESIFGSLQTPKLLATSFCLIVICTSFCYSQIPYFQIPELKTVREILKKEGKKRIDFPAERWSQPYIWASKTVGEKTLYIEDHDNLIFLKIRDTKGDYVKGDNIEYLAICQEFITLTTMTGPFRRDVTHKDLTAEEARLLVTKFLNLWLGKFKANGI